jgi:Transposase IS4
MYSNELVKEGKDCPQQILPRTYHEFRKTLGLLLHLTGSGRVVIMDSSFCILKALIDLLNVGVFSSAVIKKQQYWPKCIPGNDTDKHFDGNRNGAMESLPGTLGGKAFKVFAMKEVDYVMKITTTYHTSCREVDDGDTEQSATDPRPGQKVQGHEIDIFMGKLQFSPKLSLKI